MDYDAELQLHNTLLRRICNVQRHDHVLDVGCGTGLTTREAARSAPMREVLGVDTSATMLARARELAEAEHLQNVTFEQGDAQTHRLSHAHFDIAISRYGTMFFRDPLAAFRNICSALVPGGRLVMMVWQAHAVNEWSTAIQRCLAPDELEPIVSVQGLDPFSLSDPTKVEPMLTEAGFDEADFVDVREPVYYGENVDVAFAWLSSFVSVREQLQRLDATSAQRALQCLRETLTAHHDGSGVWFDSRAWIVTSVHNRRS
ncbi:MAG: class I SAM-dependent methyltransferase [Povalibacter sp.]